MRIPSGLQRLSLTPSILSLKVTRSRVHDECDRERQVDTDVAAVGAKFLGNRANVPRLRHAGYTACEIAGEQAEHGCGAQRKLAGLVPDCEVVASVRPRPTAEDLILDEEDDGKTDGPVSKHGDEIADNCRKMLLAGNGQNCNNDNEDQAPEKTRNGMEVVAEQLHRQT